MINGERLKLVVLNELQNTQDFVSIFHRMEFKVKASMKR